MKKFSASQVQNIVFTAVVAVAAVMIYLFVGHSDWRHRAETLSATPLAEVTEEPSPRFTPAPEKVFLANVTASKTFSAGVRKGEENAYNLVCGDEYTGAAVLTYSLDDDGCVSAIALRFASLPEPDEKSKKDADIVYAGLYPAYIARQNEAIEAMMRELLFAVDVNDVFAEPVLLRWYTGAVAARDYKKYYSETYKRCEFQAYPSQWGASQVVICSLLSLS